MSAAALAALFLLRFFLTLAIPDYYRDGHISIPDPDQEDVCVGH
jgi:hypothetical protein